MEKVWLKHYQKGVPAEINPNKYPSLNVMFEETCSQFKNRPAFANMGTTLTFGELEEKSRIFAVFLKRTLGMKKGDRIVLMMPNILQYPVALFGAWQAGLTVVNVNPFSKPRELEQELKDSEAKAILILENFANTLQQVLNSSEIEHVIVTKVGDLLSFPSSFIVNWMVKYFKRMVPKWSIERYIPFKQALAEGAKGTFQKPEIKRDDIALLQYTGGTTGIAKGAILTHGNMLANLEQIDAWVRPSVKLGEEIIITALPLYHVFSLTANGLIFLKFGALSVLITNPRDLKGFIKTLSKYPFTAFTGVNTLFNALLNHPKFATLNFKALHLALGGGMAIQHAVAERWKAVTGVTLLAAYGLTESCPAVCIMPFDSTEYNGSVGLPICSTEVSIQDEEGKELGFNQPGELCVRGPQVMQGYWKSPAETKAALQNGWLKTGDIAVIDTEGFVKIVDRKKDMIDISGFKVYPNEVEDVIALMPEVKEVAVIGVPSKEGERVKALIVKKDPTLTKEAIIKHCNTHLTKYKIPKEIEFRTELPKTIVGKVLRRALREEHKDKDI